MSARHWCETEEEESEGGGGGGGGERCRTAKAQLFDVMKMERIRRWHRRRRHLDIRVVRCLMGNAMVVVRLRSEAAEQVKVEGGEVWQSGQEDGGRM